MSGRSRGRISVALVAVLVATVAVVGSWAYWTVGGSGTASAEVGTLSAPASVHVVALPVTGEVNVTWPSVSAPGGGPVDGYVVRRTSGTTTVDACGTSLASPTTQSSCSDHGVPAGTYTYTVTAVFRTWSSTSAPSSPVVVADDATPPTVVAILPADASPTAAASVSWTVAFSEPVSGVEASDFALVAGGGVSSAAVASVTGSGSSYVVTATSGSGDGTLALRLTDDDTIVDGGGNPLGGAGTSGAGDGSLTGQAYTLDKSAPTLPVLSLDQPTGSTWLSGTTAYVNPQSGFSGSFRVSATSADPETAVAKITFATLAGATGGGDDATSPYQATYAWSSDTTASGPQPVTAVNAVGLTASATFTVTPDTTAPTVGAPTVTAGYATTTSVAVTLPAATDAGSGVASASVTLQRDSATLSAGTCGAFPGTWTTVALSGGADTTVASGQCYRYRQLASDNVGNTATSTTSGTVMVDTSAPTTPTVTLSGATGNTYVSGTTAFVNAQAGRSGAFTATATTADPESGITSVTFPTPTGMSGGGADTTSPYTASYSWSGAVTASGAQTVTALDGAGLSSSGTFTVQPDTIAPTGGALTANGGNAYSTSTSIALSITPFAETPSATASGLASSVVTRQSATLASGTCGSFSGSTVVAGATDTVATGSCYRWVLTGTDNVGNVATVTTSAVIVDTTGPSTPTVTLSAATGNSWISGTRVFINPQAGFSGGFTATTSPTDANSGINRVVFPTPTGMTGGGTDSASPYTTSYAWSGAGMGTGAQTVTAYNNAGLTAASTFTVTADTTKPAGGALTVNGTAASAAGTSSVSGTGSFTITRTDYAETASATASGLASSTLTRAFASVTGVTCGAFGSPTALTGAPAQSGLATGCYRYTLTGVDNVGNAVSITTTVVVPAITVAITSVTSGGGSSKATITGTAAAGAGSVSVVVCSTATFPCTGTTFYSGSGTPAGDGSWSVTTPNMGAPLTWWAQATQAGVASAVYGPVSTPYP